METEIRSEQPTDYAAVDAVHERAFGNMDLPNFVRAIRSNAGYRPERSLVATYADSIVGHLLMSAVGLQDEQGKVRTVTVLAPLGVDPSWQRRGIGTRLMGEAIARLEREREPCIVLRGKLGYYRRFNFVPSSGHGVLAPFPIDEEEYLFRRLHNFRPECRGTVRYPPPFSVVGYPVQWEYPPAPRPSQRS